MQHLSMDSPNEVLGKKNLNRPLKVRGSGIVQLALSEESGTALSTVTAWAGVVVVKRI